MIYDLYIYVAPTLIVISIFHLLIYRERRNRKIRFAQFDLVDSTTELLIEAKNNGHLDSDIPYISEITNHVKADDASSSMSWEGFSESVSIAKRVTQVPELVLPYKALATSAFRLSIIKAPGRTIMNTLFILGLLFVGFGIHSFRALLGKRSELVGGSILSRMPIRFC